ncbi:putative ribonucleotide reductase [Pseudomonas phage PIP]|nr:putative ribonucleotide reductase [Pseudomonas phage PIP]
MTPGEVLERENLVGSNCPNRRTNTKQRSAEVPIIPCVVLVSIQGELGKFTERPPDLDELPNTDDTTTVVDPKEGWAKAHYALLGTCGTVTILKVDIVASIRR